jgi:hypothetical protein
MSQNTDTVNQISIIYFRLIQGKKPMTMTNDELDFLYDYLTEYYELENESLRSYIIRNNTSNEGEEPFTEGEPYVEGEKKFIKMMMRTGFFLEDLEGKRLEFFSLLHLLTFQTPIIYRHFYK